MKLFSSFVKELKIASRGFYFYIEILMAVIILIIFLFAVPDTFTDKTSEYLYLDMPNEVKETYLESITDNPKKVKIVIDKVEKETSLYTTENKEIYILDSRADAIYIADVERQIVAIINVDDNQTFNYEYFLQGYESEKYKDLLKILHVESSEKIEEAVDNQDVRSLSTNFEELSDRENILPSILVFNGALMGLFIIAAYIFLDRQEGVIKAFALTPTPVWQYLMSKIGVVMITSILSSLVITVPIMKNQPDYLLLVTLLMTSAFFSSSLGLLIASFYRNMMQAFGVLYTIMMLMIIPSVAYFIPSWNPFWIRFIPSYFMLEGFKTILLGSNDWQYVLMLSGGFLLTGLIIFKISNKRYKKTLAG
ncbi:ABC transporter permease [Jeotgalibaca dankookensis]|uniref:ABC transporter permease n=1 Tax=Jeotgalibaca dankookensis TaxID=708126 RepID=UPI000786576D|nr:ABC transporter permease [Jeotgalibaca dankookensis]